ncbi:MAG: trigger factor [Dermatophilus congolensis]|nr:trigger factor [Dermatophilus congolensis]
MKSSVESLSPTRVKLTVEVPYAELKPRLDSAVTAISSQISIPGFRPGKVPARLVEQRVGKGAIVQEAVNDALPDFYMQALAENDLRPLGQPEVDITAVPVEDESEFGFTAEVDIRPSIELPDFSSVSVSVSDVDDSALDDATKEHLEELRERFGSLVPVERVAAEGDFVVIDLSGTIAGEEIDAISGVSYEIGSRTMIDGLDDALVGMNVDETKTFEAPLAGGEHEGENAEITVTVTAVKERELPELDDDFAQMASEFDTIDELNADSRKQAQRQLVLQQGVEARDKLLEHLLETLEIPVPDALIEAEVEDHLAREGRSDDDEHRAEVDESTRKGLRTQLLLDEIAEKNEVEVSQGELIEYLIMTAQQSGIDPNQLAQAMDDQNQVAAMAGEVARRKALATVLELIKVTDASGNEVDLSADVEGDESDSDEAAEGSEGGDAEAPEAEAEKPAKKAPAKKPAAKKAPAKKADADKAEDAPEADAEKA